MKRDPQSGYPRGNLRYSDGSDQPITQHLLPIKGYELFPLVPLEKAVASVSKFFDGIENSVRVARANCKDPADGLNQDESASICLYTMEFNGRPSLYKALNEALRAQNRGALKPWFSFLKLFLTALYKLPSYKSTVWRGVRGVDLSSRYPSGKKFVWWGVSSCTFRLDVLESNSFLGTHGIRTLFNIQCIDAKPIGSHSYYKNREEEFLLMPGSCFEVIARLNPADGLCLIQLKQIDPPMVLVEPPFTNFSSRSVSMKGIHLTTPMSSKLHMNKLSFLTPNVHFKVPIRRELGIIILGNTGVGKSFLANILIGEEAFVHNVSPRAVTTETEFREIRMGNETYAIFNIPGLIEADQKRIDMNKREIHKAFAQRKMSLILYIFGSQGGRIRDEDVVAFNAIDKAYPFKPESLVLIVNGLLKDRPRTYEGEVIVLLEELIKRSCANLCVLDAINKNNLYERQQLKEKLLQVIVERKVHLHEKKQEIELQSEEVRKAKAQVRELQEDFQRNKQMYKEEIEKQQKLHHDMFNAIRNENEHMWNLMKRQVEETQQLKDQMKAQADVFKAKQEQHDARHQKQIRRNEKQHQKAMREEKERNAQRIAQLERQNSKSICCMLNFLALTMPTRISIRLFKLTLFFSSSARYPILKKVVFHQFHCVSFLLHYFHSDKSYKTENFMADWD